VGEQSPGHEIGIDVPVLTKPYRREDLAHQLRVVLGAQS
jgi:hypothetical protein